MQFQKFILILVLQNLFLNYNAFNVNMLMLVKKILFLMKPVELAVILYKFKMTGLFSQIVLKPLCALQ